MENIFQHLPNDLIMRIIREADGGRDNHEKKFNQTLAQIESARSQTDQLFLELEDHEEDWIRVFFEACEIEGYYGHF